MNEQKDYKQYVVIMAGGSGVRMNSNVPKQLLKIGTEPMIIHLFKNIAKINKDIVLIVSEKNKNIMIDTLINSNYIKKNNDHYLYRNIIVHIIVQPIANGTGGAIMATKDFFINKLNSQILVLSADVPLVSKKTMLNVLDRLNVNNVNAVIVAKNTIDNYGYGRIVMDNNGFVDIIEQKDCNEEQKHITLINTGIYAFKIQALLESLEHITTNNSQKEYYLTDCPKIIKRNYPIDISTINSQNLHSMNCIDVFSFDIMSTYDETMGANTIEQLELLRNEYKKKFIVESIHNSDNNLSDNNLFNLINVLEQLTTVKINDMDSLRKYILDLKSQIINKKCILVVKYEDDIIGTGSLLIENKIIHNMGKVGHIEDVVIDNEYRSLGLATELLKKLMVLAENNSCYKIILDAADDVIEFYKKLGFNKRANTMRYDINK